MIKSCVLLISFIFATSLCTLSALAAANAPYRVYLKPGTRLKKISDKTEVELKRGIYANVLETSASRRDLFLVYDKSGKAVYETSALGIVEIEEGIRILPNVDAEVIYPPPSLLKSDNKNAFFDTQFNLHLDNLQTSAFNKIYNQDLPSALGNRYELRTLYVSDFPVNFGFGINYQTAYWANEVDSEIKLTILSFGPQIERMVYENDTLSISVLGGVEYAPVYKTTAGTLIEKYTAELFDIGAEATWETRYGKLTVGSHFRRHDLALASTTRTTTAPVPEEIIINSIGGMIGYKYEWDL